MDEADKLFVKGIFTVLMTIALTVGGCTVHQDHAVLEMIKAGASPIEASCAIGRGATTAQCAILAAKR